jgi:hypothetical protein
MRVTVQKRQRHPRLAQLGCLCLNFNTIADAAVNGFLLPATTGMSGYNPFPGSRQYSRFVSSVVAHATEAA